MRKTLLLTAGFLLLATSLARAQQTSGTYTMSVSKPAVAEGWVSEEVTFQNGDVSLAGTLTIPKARSWLRKILASPR